MGHLIRVALFTATIGFFLFSWAKSYFFIDWIFYTRCSVAGHTLVHDQYHIRSSAGGVRFDLLRYTHTYVTDQEALQARAVYSPDDGLRWSVSFHPTYPSLGRAVRFGFDWQNAQRSYLTSKVAANAHIYDLIVPYWTLALFVAALPALVLKRALARRRLEKNQTLCQNCGYDLRASPERCPECGKVRPNLDAQIASSCDKGT